MMVADERWSVEPGHFRGRGFEPGYIDLVLTEPPAGADAGLHRDLVEHAARWLAPVGWLAVVTDPRHMPALLGALAGGPLEYSWTLLLELPAAAVVAVADRGLYSAWRPIVLLRRGKPKLNWMADVLSYDWRPKPGDPLTWLPDVSPLQKLVRRCTEPGGRVADPFCGPDASVGIAALSTGRRFVGLAPDAAAAEGVRTSLRNLTAGR